MVGCSGHKRIWRKNSSSDFLNGRSLAHQHTVTTLVRLERIFTLLATTSYCTSWRHCAYTFYYLSFCLIFDWKIYFLVMMFSCRFDSLYNLDSSVPPNIDPLKNFSTKTLLCYQTANDAILERLHVGLWQLLIIFLSWQLLKVPANQKIRFRLGCFRIVWLQMLNL